MFLIIFGCPGLAKTHHAIVLGLKDCTQGYNIQVHTVATLSTELCEVNANYHLDELEPVGVGILVISDRSEKSITIVTTNLPFSK